MKDEFRGFGVWSWMKADRKKEGDDKAPPPAKDDKDCGCNPESSKPSVQKPSRPDYRK